jgi:hypothetical protein
MYTYNMTQSNLLPQPQYQPENPSISSFYSLSPFLKQFQQVLLFCFHECI